MSVIATELQPMTRDVLNGVILLAVEALINTFPMLPDGTIDLTNVRLTYGDTSFLIETGIVPEPVVAPAPSVEALLVPGVVI